MFFKNAVLEFSQLLLFTFILHATQIVCLIIFEYYFMLIFSNIESLNLISNIYFRNSTLQSRLPIDAIGGWTLRWWGLWFRRLLNLKSHIRRLPSMESRATIIIIKKEIKIVFFLNSLIFCLSSNFFFYFKFLSLNKHTHTQNQGIEFLKAIHFHLSIFHWNIVESY